MKLRYDPLQIFLASTTPAGLYARQKWLKERQRAKWQSDYASTVAILQRGQLANGSWRDSVTITVKQLFGLHLTIRHPTPQINSALGWLLTQAKRQLNFDEDHRKESVQRPMTDQLPFTAGRQDGFVLGATLFLASIFGRENHPQILSLFQMLNTDAKEGQSYWRDLTCFNNILRAFVVHPKYAAKSAVRTAVARLKRLQTTAGDWGHQLPFYQIVNALAHLDLPQAENQLRRAFNYLVKSQQPDGTWGTDQPEWNTFLVVHALKNKNIL
jgi:hypothetical protein